MASAATLSGSTWSSTEVAVATKLIASSVYDPNVTGDAAIGVSSTEAR